MPIDIRITIADDSPEAKSLEHVMEAESLSPEEAILSLIRRSSVEANAALSGLGLFGDARDAALLDEAVHSAHVERRQPTRHLNGSG